MILDDGSFNGDIGSWTSLVERVQDPVVKVIESLGGRVIHRHWLVNVISFEATLDVVYKLESMGYTVIPSLFFEPQVITIRGDLEPFDMIGVDTIGARRLHMLGITGAGVRVAILDTGIENLHPWLIRGGRSIVAWEVDATETGIVDYCGKRIGYHEGGVHGTHIAGIVAGQNPKTPGIAPGATLYDIIVFNERWWCWRASEHDILRGVELALLGPDRSPNTGDEADVINLSLGRTVAPWYLAVLAGKVKDLKVISPLHEGLRRAVSLGKLIVVAAGNSAGHYTLNYLCGVPGVICVGSSNQMNTIDRGDDRISSFSSRGPMPWYDIGPTLVAPGENIYSTVPTALVAEWGLSEPALALSGTSMAAPHISGALALLIEHYRRQGKVLTIDMTTRLLVHSSTNVYTTWALDIAGPHEVGAGLPDVYNAAFTDILVDVEGDYVTTVVALKDKVDLKLTIHNLGTTTVKAMIKVWFDDSFRPPGEDFEYVVIAPKSVDVPAGGRVTVVISIDTGKLLPGLYGGYIDVVTGDRGYRAVLSLLAPGRPVIEGLRVRVEIPVLVARHTSLYWTLMEWVAVAFYLDKPLGEYASVRLAVNDVCAIPIRVMVFDPETGYMLSPGYTGYIFDKPGLYLVFLELADDSYLWLGLLCKSVWSTVILEAPLFKTAYELLEFKIQGLELRVLELSQRISSLEGRVSGLETRFSSLESRVYDLERRVSTIEFRISDAEARLSSLVLELSTLKTRVDRLEVELANVISRISSLEGRISTLILNVSKLDLSLAKLESRVLGVEEELGRVRKDLDMIAKVIENVRMELKADVERLQKDIVSTKKSLEELTLKLNTTTSELREALKQTEGRLTKSLEEQARRVEELSGNFRTLILRLDELGENLVKINRTLDMAIENLNIRLAKLEETLTTLQKETLKFKQDLEGVHDRLEGVRKTLEVRIVEESSRAREVGERGTIIGFVALAITLLTVATLTLQTLRRKRG